MTLIDYLEQQKDPTEIRQRKGNQIIEEIVKIHSKVRKLF